MKLVPRINPVTLKEIRQLVRSRLIVWGMVALPAVILMITALVLSSETSRLTPVEVMYGRGLGKGPLIAVSVILGIVTCTAIPLLASIKTILETGKGATGLEFTTTLTPAQIVSGKIAAVAAISGIATALSLPFFVLSYLMRGINLGTTIATPFLLLVSGVAFFALQLLPACTRRPVAVRILAVLSMYMLMPMLIGVLGEIFNIRGSTMGEPMDLWDLAFGAFLFVAVLAYCRAQAAAELAPPHLDSVRTLRLTQVVLFVLSVPFAFMHQEAWSISWIAVSVMVALRAACYPGPLVRGAVLHAPRSRFLRMLAFPLATGSTPSLLFAVLMASAAISLSPLAGADFDETAGYVFFSFEFVGLLVAAGCLGRLLVASGYTRLGPAMGKFALGYILFANAMSIVAEAADGFSRKDAQVLPCNIDGLSKILSAHYLIATAIAAVALVLLVLATVMDFSKFRKP